MSSGGIRSNGTESETSGLAVSGGSISPSIGTSSTWAIQRLRAVVDAPPLTTYPGLLEALGELSEFYGDNSKEHRRGLKAELDRRALESCEEVLKTFENVQKVLVSVKGEVKSMRSDVQNVSTRLSDARLGASAVVAQTGDLRKRLSSADKRAKVAALFVKRFMLSRAEEAVLDSGEISEEFLATLAKLERIHLESRNLLRSRHQRAGLEVVEMAAARREDAYDQVYSFVQSRCGSLDVESAEDERESNLLRKSIRTLLQARPTLLRYCADEVGSARRAILVERFVHALTRGGPGGVPRPIEIHAHDAMRYTNDMLAWIHQALASERELILRLFGTMDENDNEAPFGSKEEEEEQEIAQKVLNSIFDALCRPFRVRFEQALEPQPQVVTLYKLSSLLEFYAHTMMKLLGDDAALPKTLLECNSIAMYAFFSAWRNRMESFQTSKPVPPEDLSSPIAVQQSMTRLTEIVSTLDASLSPAEAREGQIKAVLDVILNPLISLCVNMATKSLPPLEKEIFLANCIDAMRMPLLPYSFAAQRAENLTAEADEHVDRYIEQASTAVLKSCGLFDRLKRLNEAESGVPLAKVPGMDIEGLSISLKNFYAMLLGRLPTVDVDYLTPPKVGRFTNGRMRSRATLSVAEVIADAHEKIYRAINDPQNEYGQDAAVAIGLRDPNNVRVILAGQL